MEKNDFTKTIVLDKNDITGEYWRGCIHDIKYYFVNAQVRNSISTYINLGYKVIFKRGKKTALMLYNK